MAEPLQNLLMTVKVVALEKVSFSDTQIPKAVSYTMTVNDKRYLLNRDNLLQPIQMQLSKKLKTFSELFFAFLKSISNFKYLPKKNDSRS